jgi:hypothetical protein
MSATNYTPIQLYYSTTAAAVPVNTNLVSGELAINIQDEKLYFKNAAGTVKLLASNATSAPVLSFQTSLSGLSPSTATSGAITLSGTLGTSSGGTNLTSFTSGGAMYATSTSALTTGTLPTTAGGTALTSFTSGGALYATSTSALTTGTLPIASGGTGQTTASAAFNALSPITTTGDLIIGNGTNSATRLAIGTNGYILTSNGTTASWTAVSSSAVTTFSGGTTGLTPASATAGAITLAGTLAIANGGTGQTTATAALNALGGINTGKSIAMAMIFGF